MSAKDLFVNGSTVDVPRVIMATIVLFALGRWVKGRLDPEPQLVIVSQRGVSQANRSAQPDVIVVQSE